MRRIFIWMLSLSLLGVLGPSPVYGAENTAGVIQLKEYRYPVYLYVPEKYVPKLKYALLIVIPATGEDPAKLIEDWAAFGKYKNVFILVPELRPQSDEVPYDYDTWYFKLKRDLIARYSISENRVYLAGEGNAARYAGYLGLRYPEQFSGAALLGGSWAGPYMKLVGFKKTADQQIPFFVALRKQDEAGIRETEKIALELTEKGYPLRLEQIDDHENWALRDYRDRMFQWLEEKSADWKQLKASMKKPLKERVGQAVGDFFRV